MKARREQSLCEQDFQQLRCAQSSGHDDGHDGEGHADMMMVMLERELGYWALHGRLSLDFT